MSNNDFSQFDEITVADLYPELSKEELDEAEYRMLRYLAVVKEIFEEICEEKPELLTELEQQFMLRKERRNVRKL
jgi:hypothetical protein